MNGFINEYDSDYDYYAKNFHCSLDEYEELQYQLADAKEEIERLIDSEKMKQQVIKEAKELGTEQAIREAFDVLSNIVEETLRGEIIL